MPIYEFECPIHGRFDKRLNEMVDALECPICSLASPKVIALPSPHIWKELLYTDTNVPMGIHNRLVDRNRDRFEYISKKQGKVMQPEDIGEE